jgi:hypothetical protein
MQATQQIVVGQRVYCALYGGKFGTVVEVQGTQDQGPVRSLMGGAIVTGGRCNVSVVWDNGSQSRAVPECIVKGVQWQIFDEVVDAEAVAAALASAAIYDAAAKAKAEAEKVAKAKADDAARAAGLALGLIPEAEFRASGKRGTAAAYNLRAELKRAGIKATVKADGYNCLRVQIADNADKEAAKAIMGKYVAGRFDGMTDCYEYDSSAWGRVFGDVQYVFGRSVEGYTF